MGVAAFLMLLCSICIGTRSATACLEGAGGPTSFTAAPGGSQTLTWTAYAETGSGGPMTVTVTAGAGIFSVSQMPVIVPSGGTTTFTITFTPGANATGTFKGTVACPCGKTYDIVGTVAASGVSNQPLSDVSINITPNPATNFITVAASGVHTAEIRIFDLLGKEITFSKNTTWVESDKTTSKNFTWKWDSMNVPAGSYIVRVSGESIGGEQFVLSRRIIISR